MRARHDATLAAPRPDGSSERDELALLAAKLDDRSLAPPVAERVRKRLDRSHGPPLPDELAYLYHWFLEVGPDATHRELRAWQLNTGRRLEPWEIDVLRWLAGAWRKALDDAMKAHRPNEAPTDDIAALKAKARRGHGGRR